MAIIEDYTPRYVGDTARPLVHEFTDHQKKVFPLDGVNAALMTFKMKNLATGTVKVGKGTWTIDPLQSADGIASYAWHADDVADAGEWAIQAGVPFADGMQHMDIRVIEFIAPL